jgi:hypothetical protein
LERHHHMHKMISQHRASHVRSILKMQRHASKKDIRERLLRSLSAKSSRASPVKAIIRAHYDSMQLASMIRQELLDSESNAERWPKFTVPSPVESWNRRQLLFQVVVNRFLSCMLRNIWCSDILQHSYYYYNVFAKPSFEPPGFFLRFIEPRVKKPLE